MSIGTKQKRCSVHIACPRKLHPGGWRDPRPVYDARGAFIGQATSGAWSADSEKEFGPRDAHARKKHTPARAPKCASKVTVEV